MPELLSSRALTQHIQDEVIEIISALNARTFSALQPKVTSDFRISFDGVDDLNFERWTIQYTSHVQPNPDYRIEVNEAAAVDIDRSFLGIVRAFLNVDVHGAPTGVVRPSMLAFDFTEVGGRWLWSRLEGMRPGDGVGY